jgi:hypothetical protein
LSAKGHRSEYIILASLAAAAAVVLAILLAAGLVQESETAERGFRTTRSTNIEGTIVYYTLLDRLGIRARRSYGPLLSETLDEVGTVFLLDPIVPLTSDEASALALWVRKGGVLVCTGQPSRLLRKLHGIDIITQGRSPRRSLGPKTHEPPTEIPADATDLPLAQDVTSMQFESLKALVLPATERPQESAPAEHLLADSMGLRIAARPVGAGRVIVLADSSFLANGWIGKAQNAVTAVNLACYAQAHARGLVTAFDEYHFGFGRRQGGWSVLAAALFQTSPGWAVLSLTAAGLLFLVYKGRRFGTRRAPSRQRRRSKLEYVYSMGAAYEAAGAHRLAFRLIFEWFKRRAAAFAGTSSSATARDIGSALAARTKLPAQPYERLMAQCEEALASARLPRRRLSELLSRLAKAESETFNASRGSKREGSAGPGRVAQGRSRPR